MISVDASDMINGSKVIHHFEKFNATIVDEARFNLPLEHILPYMAKLINLTRYR